MFGSRSGEIPSSIMDASLCGLMCGPVCEALYWEHWWRRQQQQLVAAGGADGTDAAGSPTLMAYGAERTTLLQKEPIKDRNGGKKLDLGLE